MQTVCVCTLWTSCLLKNFKITKINFPRNTFVLSRGGWGVKQTIFTLVVTGMEMLSAFRNYLHVLMMINICTNKDGVVRGSQSLVCDTSLIRDTPDAVCQNLE